ncbi:Nitrite reductase [NAD(P)H] [Metarhizium acridum]|uniref:Nitrite reductase [NAD(P)H] n=1 Tax=Metarhizium acridum TaxID=92637 RepID=UPI001C6C20FE|nr:Nitrite reductase [NAD(P)H] [Metarhizium acridum]
MMDLESFSSVKLIERNGWVLSRQLDQEAGGMVVQQVHDLGLDVMLSKRVREIKVDGANHVVGVAFEDGEELDCSAVCFAIGITPRDELARVSGLDCVPRCGGIAVGDDLRTSQPDIYAIGECASWQGQTFGLIGPGVEMAEVVAFNLTQAKLHAPRVFKRPDLSTKLKLLGVNVASFGDFFADRDGPAHLPAKHNKLVNGAAKQAQTVKTLTYKDPFQNIYKKYIFTSDGKYLLGGMMIGDTNDYIKVSPMVKTMKELDVPPSQFILGAKKDGDGDGDDDLPDDTQICSCHKRHQSRRRELRQGRIMQGPGRRQVMHKGGHGVRRVHASRHDNLQQDQWRPWATRSRTTSVRTSATRAPSCTTSSA